MSNGNAANLEQTIIEGIVGALERAYVPGRLGRINADGTVSVLVPGRPGYVYVRLGPEGERGVTIAYNKGVPRRAHFPVRLLQIRGEWVVVDADHTAGRLDAFLGSGGAGGVVPYHTHAVGSGLEYEIEALRLEPGRVRWASGLTVYLGPFRYRLAGGGWQTWPGGNLDLTPFVPATTGHHAWALIGVDPASNTAVAAAGASQDVNVALTEDQIDDIAFGDYIPLAAIRLVNGDTTLRQIERYRDARGWLNSVGASFNDTEGDPADVTTGPGADGTSSYAARRDHVHGLADSAVTNTKLADSAVTSSKLADNAVTNTKLADNAVTNPKLADSAVDTAELSDNAVTNAKLADMAEATVKGRAAGAGAGDPQDLTAAQLSAIVGSSLDHGSLTGLGDDDHAQYLLANGSRPLTGDWDIGEDRRIKAEVVQARDNEGLSIVDDSGILGLFVEDGGQVGVGTGAPAYPLHLRAAAPAVLRVTGHKDGGSFADGEVIGELHFDAEDADAPGSTVDANVVLRAIARSVQQSGNKQSDLAILVKPFSGNYDQTDLEVARFTYEGKVGIGVTSPQGKLHAHDGVGGMLHWSHSAVGATAVTIIPDGAGDVVWGILFLLVIESGGARGADLFQVNNGASVNVPVGGGTWTFAVSTAGALTVQRTAGSGTARITLLGCWL